MQKYFQYYTIEFKRNLNKLQDYYRKYQICRWIKSDLFQHFDKYIYVWVIEKNNDHNKENYMSKRQMVPNH